MMSRTETIMIGITGGILCPVLLFVGFWWITATLHIAQILHISEGGIAIAAFSGLALGIVLDLLYLRRWISRFFLLDLRLIALVYLFCSVIALSFFMGLPIGNLVLGALAGIYIGRREYYSAKSEAIASKTVIKASLFTALVTGAESFTMGLLALNENWVVEWLQAVTGIDSAAVIDLLGIGLIGILCVLLMAVQFWCTKTIAWIAFGHGRLDNSPECD